MVDGRQFFAAVPPIDCAVQSAWMFDLCLNSLVKFSCLISSVPTFQERREKVFLQLSWMNKKIAPRFFRDVTGF